MFEAGDLVPAWMCVRAEVFIGIAQPVSMIIGQMGRQDADGVVDFLNMVTDRHAARTDSVHILDILQHRTLRYEILGCAGTNSLIR